MNISTNHVHIHITIPWFQYFFYIVYTDFSFYLWLPHNDTWLGNRAIPFLYYRRLCSGAPVKISSCPLLHTRKRRHLALLGLSKKHKHCSDQSVDQSVDQSINHHVVRVNVNWDMHSLKLSFNIQSLINALIDTQELPS